MNYSSHYSKLISRASSRVLDGYSEKHHIIPVCMGGIDSVENLVMLTPEEHYIAHQLLVKMYPANNSLIYAANMMAQTRKGNKIYGWLKRRFSETHSARMKIVMAGIPKSEIHKANMRKPKSNTKNMHSMLGKKHSDATKATMSKNRLGQNKSEEHKVAIGKALIGNNNRDWTGKHHSEKTKNKMSASQQNRSPETLMKMSVARKGIMHTEETKTKIKTIINGRGGRCWINKNGNQSLVFRDSLQQQLDLGWKLGRS